MEESTVTAKQELRRSIRHIRRIRANTPNAATLGDSRRIADHVMSLKEVQHACVEGLPIGCYVSRPDEPPTEELRTRLLAAGALLLLPRIEHEDLVWVHETPHIRWVSNRWNITEPDGPTSDQVPGIWIVPGLAVDSAGYRLGQGGGYYDRALETVRDDVPIIAIVFEDEVVDEVPREAHDKRVDIVVTPERVRWLSMPD